MTELTTAPTGRVFISYRRAETDFAAGWLYDRLVGQFGRDQIFKDVDSIELGDDFAEVIANAVGSCDVLLVLIGSQWLSITDNAGKRRLDDPNDFVRLEVEAALERKVRVIPILVGGVDMPRIDQLPASLAGLARRQALDLSPTRFRSDTERLLRVLDRTLSDDRAKRDVVERARVAEEPDLSKRIMLTPAEWRLVTELARDHLFDTREPIQQLSGIFDRQFIAGFRLGVTAADNARALVAALKREGLHGSEPPLLSLLNGLLRIPAVSVLPESLEVREMLRRVESACRVGEEQQMLHASLPIPRPPPDDDWEVVW